MDGVSGPLPGPADGDYDGFKQHVALPWAVFRLVRMGRARGLCRIRDVLTLSTFEHSPPMSANELLEAANRLLRQSTNQRVTERTLRYYVAKDLVPPPAGPPKLARYMFRHLVCLVAIKILQDLGFSLDGVKQEIQPALALDDEAEYRQFVADLDRWLMKARPGHPPAGLDWPRTFPQDPDYGLGLVSDSPARGRRRGWSLEPLEPQTHARRPAAPGNVYQEIQRLREELDRVKEAIAGYPDEDRDELFRVIRELRRAVEDLREEVRRLREATEEREQPAAGEP